MQARDKFGRFTKNPVVTAAVNMNNINYVVVVLDKSSSISSYGLTDGMINQYNRLLSTIRSESEKNRQNTYLSLLLFDSRITIVHDFIRIDKTTELTYAHYQPWGNTALFDAIQEGYNRLMDKNKNSNISSYLLIALTDGQENSSKLYHDQRQLLMRNMRDNPHFTFAIQVPKGYKSDLVRSYNVDPEAISEWETTEVGLVEATVRNQAGVKNYFENRSVGKTSVKKFYEVTTDLSDVNKKDLKSLDDISGKFKRYAVEKESIVKDFVEAKTKKPYVIGSVFYQLTKTEKVQPTKDILIVEKGKTKVYGGFQARKLIGLPTDGVSHAKVIPGNHANYDIFVKSTSVNRILVRGTAVYVDLDKVSNDVPTWDHTARQ